MAAQHGEDVSYRLAQFDRRPGAGDGRRRALQRLQPPGRDAKRLEGGVDRAAEVAGLPLHHEADRAVLLPNAPAVLAQIEKAFAPPEQPFPAQRTDSQPVRQGDDGARPPGFVTPPQRFGPKRPVAGYAASDLDTHTEFRMIDVMVLHPCVEQRDVPDPAREQHGARYLSRR